MNTNAAAHDFQCVGAKLILNRCIPEIEITEDGLKIVHPDQHEEI
jgi:hypothetical protein